MEININQKKEFIVFTAIDLIHENGMNNVSTKEIAKRVGISEGLIFKIYPKKYDLILAVLDYFSLYDKDLYITAQDKNNDSIEAILFYLNKFLAYYENYPAITSIYQILDMKHNISQIDARTKEIYLNRMEYIKQLVIKAQEDGKINNTVDPDLVTDILYSTFKGMCIKWRRMDFDFSLQDRTNNALRLILKALEIRKDN